MELTPPRGTADLLPPDSAAMAALYERAHRRADIFGYRYVETPVIEHTELFHRTSGETSDVVAKETYTFEDRGGRMLTLRAEGTAPVVRAYLAKAHDLGTPFKAYYVNQAWRYGRPQRGRLREFRVFGAEVIGVGAAEADVDIILLAERFLREDIGLQQLDLQVNSIGDDVCRPAYRQELLEYLTAQSPRLRDEHRDRFRENPMRVLDCKDEACRDVALDAPKITDRLCGPCREHFDQVLSALESEGVKAEVTPTLVRGLDYYTRTAFEFVSGVLSEQQGTVCGGGRYDGLAEVLGGPPTPGVGFGLGLDRAFLAAQEEGVEIVPPSGVTAFVVGIGAGRARGSELVRQLRAAGVPTDAPFEERPLKAQLRMADRAGARFALIVGDREAGEGSVTVRRMTDGEQSTVPFTDVASWISAQG